MDLATVGPGFSAPELESQAVFRVALQALSRPGTIVRCAPGEAGDAGTALALALLDQDTRLWISPALHESAQRLRFHTGCVLTGDSADADFLFAGNARELPALEDLNPGSDEMPHRSATVILRVDGLIEGSGWRLSGPGIERSRYLTVEGVDDTFAEALRCNARRFPRGVDFFFFAGDRLCGLPRTTRLET